ncbi:MAG: group II intron reverse transcriptase domain-containing protein [Desulfovibrio sp.]|nr:group II intron reverse transcriptase domain-containing protein [Desulfovibrio sp.]
MPRKAKHLWPHILAYENLCAAFKKVRLGKRFRPSIVKIYYNLSDRLFEIQEQLRNKTWRPGPSRTFMVQEVKPRLIQAPAAVDRVVHWALMLQAAPYLERRFIYDSYACREGKGAHAASRRATDYLRKATHLWGRPYIIKADISKYFPSIDQGILMQTLQSIFADQDVLWLFSRIIRAEQSQGVPDAELDDLPYGTGLVIGALTSQWLANLFFDPVDHFIKDDLGIKFYLRYMDDFVIIGPSKLWCHTVLDTVAQYLACRKLHLNPKTSIFPASHGLDFVGYRHWTNYTLPRKRTVKRARLRFRHLREQYARGRIDLDYVRPRVASFTGYMQHCDGHVTLEHILERFVLQKPS